MLHACSMFACSCKRGITKLNWHGLVFDELTNGQAVMQYSRHRLTASVAYETMLTYALTNDQYVRSGRLLVSSSKTEPCQFSSVTSLCIRTLRTIVWKDMTRIDHDMQWKRCIHMTHLSWVAAGRAKFWAVTKVLVYRLLLRKFSFRSKKCVAEKPRSCWNLGAKLLKFWAH